MKDNLIKKYITETTVTNNYPDVGGIVGDDDFPPGNIVFGNKSKKIPYKNRLTGYEMIWDVDDGEWKWDEFENSKGMEDIDNYSDTLEKLDKIIPNFDISRHMKPNVPDHEYSNDYNRTPQKKNSKNKTGYDNDKSVDVPKDITVRLTKIIKKGK